MKKDPQKIIKRTVFVIFVLQVLYIVYLNLFECHSWIDEDAAMLYSHTISMWKQKTFVLPAFSEHTFLNIDTSCFLAMPIYGLIKDIFLAYGIANLIFLAGTLYVMNDLMKKFCRNDTYRYAAMIVYLIPYRMGLVQYTNMLFFECSFYNFCILSMILAIDLFFAKKEEEGSRKWYILLAVYVLLTAVTAFSRGTYTLLAALLPVLVCYALEVILSEEGCTHIRRSKVIVIAATFLSYILGMGFGKIIGAEPKVDGYPLVLPKDILNNFFHVFWGHISIFMDRATPEIFSIEGIRYLITFAFSIFMLIVVIFNLKHAFKDEKGSNELRYLTIVYLWDVCIVGLTDCSNSGWAFPERYIFPGIIAVMLSLPIMLEAIEPVKRTLLKQTLFVVTAAIIFVTLVTCNINTAFAIKANAEENSGMKEVIETAKKNGVDTVFFLNDPNAAWITRSIWPDMKITDIEASEDGSFIVRNDENFQCVLDRAYYSDENIIAVTWNEQPETFLHDYMFSSYQGIGDVEGYHLYMAGSNKFDGISGFPLNDNVMTKSTDFVYTEGYQVIGDIDAYGYLETIGIDDYILLSPLFDAPFTDCNVTLEYEMGHKTDEGSVSTVSPGVAGKLRLLDENLQTISETDIETDKTETVVTAQAGKPCYVAVWLSKDVPMTIHKIDFEVSGK